MKKIVAINSVNIGSTGRIMLQLGEDIAQKLDVEFLTVCAGSRTNRKYKRKNQIYIGNPVGLAVHRFLGKYTGKSGCFSHISTLRLISKLKKQSPDLIHLHNLHNCYINIPILFSYIKKYKIPVVWTLHDCWSFTGKCASFDMCGCDRWKSGCGHCSQLSEYPESFCDKTLKMFQIKKQCFTNIDNMTIVTPSYWLRDLVKQSFLQKYNVEVIHNGIDVDIFKPKESKFKKKYKLEDKIIVLGVSFSWGVAKGIDVFCKLANELPAKFKVVLVGVTESQENNLPASILAIRKTNSQQELAEIYAGADILLNPTRQDNFPTVNLEALACGLPIFTFNTGGSPECLTNNCGKIISEENVLEEILAFEASNFSKMECAARGKDFDKKFVSEQYCNIYKKLLEI